MIDSSWLISSPLFLWDGFSSSTQSSLDKGILTLPVVSWQSCSYMYEFNVGSLVKLYLDSQTAAVCMTQTLKYIFLHPYQQCYITLFFPSYEDCLVFQMKQMMLYSLDTPKTNKHATKATLFFWSEWKSGNVSWLWIVNSKRLFSRSEKTHCCASNSSDSGELVVNFAVVRCTV